MIDSQSFAKWMGILADRFGRPLKAPTQGAYYAALSARLTTAQFEAAALHVLSAQRFNAWPAPGEFIDAVQPPDATPSPQLAFDRVYTLAATTRAHGKRWEVLEAEIAADVGPAAARAARALRSRWSRHDESELPFLRRDFVAEYDLATSTEARREQVEALLPGTVQRALADPRTAVLALPAPAYVPEMTERAAPPVAGTIAPPPGSALARRLMLARGAAPDGPTTPVDLSAAKARWAGFGRDTAPAADA